MLKPCARANGLPCALSMHRFFVEKEDILQSKALIRPDECTHIKVLRLGEGDSVELIDGQGGRYSAILAEVSKTGILAQIIEALPSNEPDIEVTLYQGAPKGAKAELIVQKCAELGVCAFAPVYFKNGDVKPSEGNKNPQRLAKIAREAAKQCGRGFAPIIHPPRRLDEAIQAMKQHDLLLVPWERGAQPFKQALAHSKHRSIGIIIGPEGGIREEEIALLEREAGAVPVTLGRRILRTETAAIAALAAVMCLAEQWV